MLRIDEKLDARKFFPSKKRYTREEEGMIRMANYMTTTVVGVTKELKKLEKEVESVKEEYGLLPRPRSARRGFSATFHGSLPRSRSSPQTPSPSTSPRQSPLLLQSPRLKASHAPPDIPALNLDRLELKRNAGNRAGNDDEVSDLEDQMKAVTARLSQRANSTPAWNIEDVVTATSSQSIRPRSEQAERESEEETSEGRRLSILQALPATPSSRRGSPMHVTSDRIRAASVHFGIRPLSSALSDRAPHSQGGMPPRSNTHTAISKKEEDVKDSIAPAKRLKSMRAFSVENLTELQEIFEAEVERAARARELQSAEDEEDDEEEVEGLNQEQFVKVFSQVLSLPEPALVRLYEKVDANGDGTVEWKEFLDYLMQETLVQQAEEELTHRSFSNLRLSLAPSTARHSQMITKIRIFKEEDVYATCGRDGIVRCWDADTLSLRCDLRPYEETSLKGTFPRMAQSAPSMSRRATCTERSQSPRTARSIIDYPEHHRPPVQNADYPKPTAKGRRPSLKAMRHSTRWATDVACSSNLSAIAVGTFDSALSIYAYKVQLSSNSIAPAMKVSTAAPVTATAFFRHNLHCAGQQDVLAYSDLDGNVGLEMLTRERLGDLSCRHVVLKQVHQSSVVDMVTAPGGLLLTGDVDGSLCFSDGERLEPIWRCREGHRKSILALAHAPSFHASASVGLDRCVCLWDPHTGKCASRTELPPLPLNLGGVDAAPAGIDFNERQNELVIVGGGKFIRVFDIRMMKVVQSVLDRGSYYPHDSLSACAFDADHSCLLVAGNFLRVYAAGNPDDHVHSATSTMKSIPKILRRLKPNVEDEAMEVAVKIPGQTSRELEGTLKELKGTIVLLLYSTKYYRVIALSLEGAVSVYDPTTGRRLLGFDVCAEHEHTPITAACLDHLERRLVLGDHSGRVTMWNYNSGQVISILEQQSNEISCLCWVKHSGVKRPIVGVCWGKSTLFWPDVGAESSIEALSIEANDADVVTATAGTVKTSLVVTGSADGVVMIWDVHKMKPTMKITLPRDPRPPLMKEQNNQRFVPDSPRSYHRLRQRRRLSGTVVEQIVLVDNDNIAVTLTGSGQLHAYSLYSGKLFVRAGVSVGASPRAAVDPSRSLLFVGDMDGYLTLVNLRKLRSRRLDPLEWRSRRKGLAKTQELECASPGSDSEGDAEEIVKLLKRWRGHDHHVTAVAFANIMSVFVSSSDDGKIRLWTVDGEVFGYFGQRSAWPIELVNRSKPARDQIDAVDVIEEEDEKDTLNAVSADVRLRIKSASLLSKPPSVPLPEKTRSRAILHSQSRKTLKEREAFQTLSAQYVGRSSSEKERQSKAKAESIQNEATLLSLAQERAKRTKGLLSNSLDRTEATAFAERKLLAPEVAGPFDVFLDSLILRAELDKLHNPEIQKQENEQHGAALERTMTLRHKRKSPHVAEELNSARSCPATDTADTNTLEHKPPTPSASFLLLRAKLQEQVRAYWRFRDEFNIKVL